ncbi:hypothetical protein D3C71_1826290 [compost metagenome]
MGHFRQSVAPLFRGGTCVGGTALDLQVQAVDAVGGDSHGILVRRLVGEHVVMFAGQFADDGFGAG